MTPASFLRSTQKIKNALNDFFVTNTNIKQGVRTIADLTTKRDQPDNSNVFVMGYYTPGDNGGGLFCWQNNSADDIDNGIIFAPTGNNQPIGRWKRIYNGGPVNIRWFGTKANDSNNNGMNIKDAFKRALLYAQSVDAPIYFPSGQYVIDLEANWYNQYIPINFDTQIIGAGSTTRIRLINSGNASGRMRCPGLVIDSTKNVMFVNMWLHMDDTYISTAIQHGIKRSSENDNHVTGELKIHRVKITGVGGEPDGPYQSGHCCIESSAGSGFVEITECDFSLKENRRGVLVSCWSTDDYGSFFGKRLHVSNSYFHDVGLDNDGEGFYVHPKIAIDFEDCKFARIRRNCVQHYGASAETTDAPPSYVRFTNCDFRDSSNGVLTGNAHTTGQNDYRPTVFQGCMFHNCACGIALRGPVAVRDSTFVGHTGVSAYDYPDSNPINSFFENCNFSSGNDSSCISVNDGKFNNATWNFKNCKFRNVSNSTWSLIIVHTRGINTDDAHMHFENCEFKSFTSMFYLSRSISFINCRMELLGKHWMAAVVGNGEPFTIKMRKCDLKNSGYGFLSDNNTINKPQITFIGDSNSGVGKMIITRANNGMTLNPGRPNSQLTLKPSIGNNMKIAPSWNYNTYHLGGFGSPDEADTYKIQDILIEDSVDTTKCCTGRLFLICDNQYVKFNNTGNIIPRNGLPYMAVKHEIVVLIAERDNDNNVKWRQI